MSTNGVEPAVQPNNWFANVIGTSVVMFLCWATGYLLIKVIGVNKDLSEQVSNIVYVFLGFLTAKLGTVVDWAFSGTSTTKRQGETISTLVNTAAVKAATTEEKKV